jgi:hypothetical protein
VAGSPAYKGNLRLILKGALMIYTKILRPILLQNQKTVDDEITKIKVSVSSQLAKSGRSGIRCSKAAIVSNKISSTLQFSTT